MMVVSGRVVCRLTFHTDDTGAAYVTPHKEDCASLRREGSAIR